jgi:serine/threonine protein kinase
VPKVIDCGVAKAMGQKLTERTLFTGFGGIIGTLEYMSPEQAEFNSLDIDTPSDIYSLGVLLYELLTGSTPLTKERLKQAAITEVLRAIREEDPPRPSTRLSESNGHANMPPGESGGRPAGGNQIVIEVAPREFLFLCHLQPGSITVQPGDRVATGQVLGRIGNSGNTSEPHLHIHLQDSPTDDEGDGIPLYFHQYRLDGKIIERGMPTGGFQPQVVEHAP